MRVIDPNGFLFRLGDCGAWNLTFHYYDEDWPNKLGNMINTPLSPEREKNVYVMPKGINVMAIR